MRPGVFVPLVPAQSLLDVSRSLIYRCYDRAGCGVRLLSRVYRLCCKSHKQRMGLTCWESATNIKESTTKKKETRIEIFHRRHTSDMYPTMNPRHETT